MLRSGLTIHQQFSDSLQEIHQVFCAESCLGCGCHCSPLLMTGNLCPRSSWQSISENKRNSVSH
jgi:hypothetical protein